MCDILVIERNAQFLENLEEWLTLYEFSIITTNRLEIGYRLACSEQPKLILCGYGFPEFDGLHLLQTLRNHPNTSATLFLLMTGAYLQDIPNWQTHLKQDDILFKPFDIYSLLKTLRFKLSSS
jgi:DNA-binding response OmpR family regulator